MKIHEKGICFWDPDAEAIENSVRKFLNIANEMLANGSLTKEQYDEMTYNKIEFLVYLEKERAKQEKIAIG